MNTKKINDYFSGLLLTPWIWGVGYYLVLLVFYSFYRNHDDFVQIRRTASGGGLAQILEPGAMMALFGYLLVLNYTLTFFVKEKYPKIEILFFLSTLLLLGFLTLFLFPYLKLVLSA
jgi:hypothetical protein